jgi:tetratricopeptide (TPR) repeat protein
MRRRALVALALLGGAGAAAGSQIGLERLQAGRGAGWRLMYLPNGRYLKIASLGFAPVVADLIYLWSIQYYGSYDPSVRYDIVEHVYVNVIGELDPRYTDAYTLASLILTTEAGAPERALKVLDVGMERNPDNWLMPYEAGFIAFNSLHDYGRAAGYYARCAAIPGAHPVARRFMAEMYNKKGDKSTSFEKWREIYETAEDDFVRDVAFSHMHDLRIELDLEALRQAVSAYGERHGSHPPGLEAVVREGLLSALPADPEGNPYTYDPRTGEVRAQSRFRLWRR